MRSEETLSDFIINSDKDGWYFTYTDETEDDACGAVTRKVYVDENALLRLNESSEVALKEIAGDMIPGEHKRSDIDKLDRSVTMMLVSQDRQFTQLNKEMERTKDMLVELINCLNDNEKVKKRFFGDESGGAL